MCVVYFVFKSIIKNQASANKCLVTFHDSRYKWYLWCENWYILVMLTKKNNVSNCCININLEFKKKD